MTRDADRYFFQCIKTLKNEKICVMDCFTNPEGVIITPKNQYELAIIEGWVNQEGEYCTRLLFTVENVKNEITETIKNIKRILDTNITDPDEPYNLLSPIIVDDRILEQILD